MAKNEYMYGQNTDLWKNGYNDGYFPFESNAFVSRDNHIDSTNNTPDLIYQNYYYPFFNQPYRQSTYHNNLGSIYKQNMCTPIEGFQTTTGGGATHTIPFKQLNPKLRGAAVEGYKRPSGGSGGGRWSGGSGGRRHWGGGGGKRHWGGGGRRYWSGTGGRYWGGGYYPYYWDPYYYDPLYVTAPVVVGDTIIDQVTPGPTQAPVIVRDDGMMMYILIGLMIAILVGFIMKR